MSHAILASVAALSTCTGLPAGDIKTPEYWGNYFLDKYATERAAAMNLAGEDAPEPLEHPRTVLLITGVTIPAEWFDPMVARLVRDGFNPVVYEPPALLSGDLFENSKALGLVIDSIRAQTGEEKIDILAECTGGLLARHYIQALGGDKHVSRLVTFISPQNGLPKAAFAYDTVGWPALDDLTPGSLFLETVNNAPLPANVPVTSIYTCTDEYIQPYKTSIIPGAKNIGVACDGKSFIGHFQFFYDVEMYRLMHSELTAGGEPDPTTDPEPEPTEEAAGGCSTTGEGASPLLLLAAALFIARRRRR